MNLYYFKVNWDFLVVAQTEGEALEIAQLRVDDSAKFEHIVEIVPIEPELVVDIQEDLHNIIVNIYPGKGKG